MLSEESVLITINNPSISKIVLRRKFVLLLHLFIFFSCCIFLFNSDLIFNRKFSLPISVGSLFLIGWYLVTLLHDYKNQNIKFVFYNKGLDISDNNQATNISYEQIYFYEIQKNELFFCYLFNGMPRTQRIYVDSHIIYDLLTEKCTNYSKRMSYKECRLLSNHFNRVYKIGISLLLANLFFLLYLIIGFSNSITGLLFSILGGMSIVGILLIYEYLERLRLTLNASTKLDAN